MQIERVHVKLEKNQFEKFKNLAKNLHKTRSQILRDLIDKEIKKHDKNKN